jgi:iron-sulfur cluster repair protein YtfE (RIC family)
MKRHESIKALSREHHGALILAQLLKKNAPPYKGLPVDPMGKEAYAMGFYRDELAKHFEKEEEVLLKKILGTDPRLDELSGEIIAEHAGLRALFETVHGAGDLAGHLHRLGVALEAHIRKEERIFFPLVEKVCSESLLSAIAKDLSV